MDTQRNIPTWGYKLILLSAAAVWGISFVVLKDALDSMGASWLLTFRFGFATLVLVIVLFGRLREHLNTAYIPAGIALGIAYGGAYVFQTYGLSLTTPGKNAFITALYCVIVPYLVWIIGGRKPGAHNLVAAFLAVAGIGLISLGDDFTFAMGPGDMLTLVCAVLYAVHMVFVPRFAEGRDVLSLTVVQLATCTVVAFVCALIFDEPPTAAVLTPNFIGAMAYLVIFCSCWSMAAQNVGQANVNPASAALIMSLESVFAVITSIIFYGEVITPQLALGFALIFVAVIVSEVIGAQKENEQDAGSIVA